MSDDVKAARDGTDQCVIRQLRDQRNDARAEVERLRAALDRSRSAHVRDVGEVSEERDRYREALEHADQVLSRILAPCPRCHTLGRDPGCLTLVHYLPDEARQDIREARSEARAALDGDGQ